MKKQFAAFVLAASVLPVSSPALATSRSIPLEAKVPAFCSIEGSTADITESKEIVAVDAEVFVVPTAIHRNYRVICNKDAVVTLISTNGAMTGPSPESGFQHFILYTAESEGFTDAPIPPGTTSNAGPKEKLGEEKRSKPGIEALKVTITPIVNSDPLLPGTYQDTLVVRVEPHP